MINYQAPCHFKLKNRNTRETSKIERESYTIIATSGITLAHEEVKVKIYNITRDIKIKIRKIGRHIVNSSP